MLNRRRHPDLNRGMEVLQTSALPLGYAAATENTMADRAMCESG